MKKVCIDNFLTKPLTSAAKGVRLRVRRTPEMTPAHPPALPPCACACSPRHLAATVVYYLAPRLRASFSFRRLIIN